MTSDRVTLVVLTYAGVCMAACGSDTDAPDGVSGAGGGAGVSGTAGATGKGGAGKGGTAGAAGKSVGSGGNSGGAGASLATSCGAPARVNTCDLITAGSNYPGCVEAYGEPITKAFCDALQGQLSETPCPNDGIIALCIVPYDLGPDLGQFYYDPDTPYDWKKSCLNTKGTWCGP